MKKLSIFIFVILFTFLGCSTDLPREDVRKKETTELAVEAIASKTLKGPYIHAEFEIIAAEFLDECKKRKISRKMYRKLDSIVYKHIEPIIYNYFIFNDDGTVDLGADTIEVIGQCWPSKRKIDIRDDMVAPQVARLILFHELGHCVLRKGHIDMGRLAIMNPSLDIDNIDDYFVDWDSLLDDFFSENALQAHLIAPERDGPCRFK